MLLAHPVGLVTDVKGRSPSTTVYRIGLQVRHKKKLEERLAEVEQALRIFSQRRVLVKSDGAG
jgi:hypothetical protein